MKLTTLITALPAAIATQPPQVDLGYDVYQGFTNHSTGLNIYKGIRFAAPPTGSLRWQAPQPPAYNRTSVIPANTFGAACPQSLRSGLASRVAPSPIDEDCLFLNVYAPQNASELPVLVWIHGGGYGVGDGREDLSRLINANDNNFLGVAIQYRLGAFGFLASDEVFRSGATNAGLLDQKFALQWVQQHIHRFGGDPRRVTIWGVSAGAGSVMLHNIASGGEQGTSLYTNSISSSPFLPQQYNYSDWIPSQSYYAFASRAGCFPPVAYGNSSQPIFQCLVSRSTSTLQAASDAVSRSGRHGTWAFLPVTDGIYIRTTPSRALHSGPLNGLAHLTSNAAEEGLYYVPQNITTTTDLHAWISLVFPLFTPTDTTLLLSHYPSSNLPLNRLPTSGLQTPSALETSATASGIQQTINLIYSESTFICPSHWLAQASTQHGTGGWKFQTSTPISLHGIDDTAVFNNRPLPTYGTDYIRAVQRVWGAFITSSDPAVWGFGAALENWPKFSSPLRGEGGRWMVNLNQTGGVVRMVDKGLNPQLSEIDAVWSVGPGLRNEFSVVDGDAWEGGRGERCEFWRSVAGRVPM